MIAMEKKAMKREIIPVNIKRISLVIGNEFGF
jgi:hypothetical protein